MGPRWFHRPRPPARRPKRTAPRPDWPEDRRLFATFSPLASAADGSADPLRAGVIAVDGNGQDNTIALQSGADQPR